MATKSILKTVYIKDNDTARRFANALENAAQKTAKQVKFNRSVSAASKKDIHEMFDREDAE